VNRVAICAALLAAACAEPRPANVLLVSFDTVRADHCSVNGYHRATTPALAALAAEGARFATAYAPSATTAPSHATLFTSLAAPAHGVVKNGVLLESGPRTLAETFRDAGYQTAGVVSSLVLARQFGWSRGFDVWEDRFDPLRSSVTQFDGVVVPAGFDRPGDDTTRIALDWIRSRRDPARPFFLFVHYFDAHAPYVPPAAFAARFPPEGEGKQAAAIARYDAEIAFADASFGDLLAGLREAGLERDTIVVASADHGEGLGERGVPEHGVHVHEEAVRVPLLLRWPGRVPARLEIDAPVSWLDLAPTLADLAALSRPPGWQGESLRAALLDGAPLDPSRPVHLFRRHYLPGLVQGVHVEGEKYGLRLGTWKYVQGPAEQSEELYDLAADPHEDTNLAATRAAERARLAARVDAWRAALPARGEAPRLEAEVREQLEALGYTE
jgi:arylsulfatase A-like enzyme